MTDEELSMLLRQWERTPAPPSLDARVFRARRDRRWIFPVPAVALAGAAAGVLGVLAVLRLTMPAVHNPPTAPVVEQAVLPTAPVERPHPSSAAARKPKTKPIKKAGFLWAMDSVEADRRVLIAPRPEYPPDARAALVEGVVELQVVIGKDGHVIEAKVLSGDPLLADAAVESVKRWLYQPAALNGEPVGVITQVNVTFTLSAPKAVKK